MSNNVKNSELINDKKTQKAIQKENLGKSLSSKEKERLRLLKTKLVYKKKSDYALILKNVKKSFNGKKVLRGVSFEIKKGEKVALIGKNGAGKSTLINVLSQQLKMSEGEIRYGYASNRLESLELMGIQFQTLNYPEGFVVKDVIHFFNVSVEKTIRMDKQELSDMISIFGIDKFLNQKIDRLSGGQQQRINILLALIKKPKLLILDEISTGLDVESSEVIKTYIKKYLKENVKTSLLLISHLDEEIREMTDRVIILDSGKISENFPSSELDNERFLEITSREPKLSTKEKIKQDKESEEFLKKFEKKYNIKEAGKLRNYFSSLKRKVSLSIARIDNSNINTRNLIEINNLSKTYDKKVGAVRELNLNIVDGERVAITGPNGSGKSTVVELIAQVKKPDRKKDRFKNKLNLAKYDLKRELKKIHEDINIKLRNFEIDFKIEISKFKNEIKELLSSKNNKIKEIKKNFNKSESKKKILELENFIENRIKELNEKINFLQKNHDKEYLELKNKLHETIHNKESLKESKYYEEIEKIKLEMNNYKNFKLFKKKNNLEESFFQKNIGVNSNQNLIKKPLISYKFTNISRDVKDLTGVQFQYASFPTDMTVFDVIMFFSRTNERFLSKEEMIEAIKVFKLEKLLKAKAYTLSGGERQRLNVLLAIMKKPKLLILDEISTGLDVDSIMKIDKFIKDYLDKSKATLILISHNYHEVHSLTSKIVVMKYGKLSEIVTTRRWSLEDTKSKMRDIYKGGGI
ncbi:MAG: hypothetical protein TYPL_1590 [Candidatus Tyloplasma litorale]|nr:MAG: hypothetical protein TYPL_1590 [Mycoplasmatales bacterium]